MPLQNFVDKTSRVTTAWLNAVDVMLETVMGTPGTKPLARTALTSDLPLEIANGGTAARDAATALSSLGAFPASSFTQAQIGAAFYPATQAENTALAIPVNFQYPPMLVDRYKTNTTPGTTDMTSAWQAAIATAAVNGGTVTCLQTAYLTSSTLVIAAGVTIDGGNALNTYVLGGCAQIVSNSNFPLLQYNNGSRFTGLRNISLVGNAGQAAQDGIIIGQANSASAHGIRIQNIGIWNCGRYGISVLNSVSGDYQSIYVSGCTDGIVVNATGASSVGANRWYNINVTSSVSVDIDINGTGGGVDSWYGVTVESSPYGLVFESGVVGQIFYGVHSEGHATQSVLFKAGSNKNIVNCETVGSSEPLPLNQGSAQNIWTGGWVVSGVFKDPIAAKCIQRISTLASTVVSGAALSAYSTASAPTNTGGLQILSQAITQKNTGSRLVVRAWGIAKIGTTGTLVVALFGPGSNTAVEAIQVPATGGIFYNWSLEYEIAAGTQNSVSTFTVNIGSTTAADTAAAFGQFGGSIASGGISVEEYLPSTG